MGSRTEDLRSPKNDRLLTRFILRKILLKVSLVYQIIGETKRMKIFLGGGEGGTEVNIFHLFESESEKVKNTKRGLNGEREEERRRNEVRVSERGW